MGNEKLVSVYINVYNREDLIGETLRSVLDQTYQNLQIIVVDDCSSDRTAEVVRSFQDPRIELYVLDENKNVVGALNECLTHIKGEYLAHVDSDDIWEPEKIEKQVRFLEENPEYGSCFTLVNIIDENGNSYEGNGVLNKSLFAMENLSQAGLLRDYYERSNHINHSSMMARRSLLEKTGGYDLAYQYLHDFELWIRFTLAAPTYIIQEELVRYRVHSGNYSDPDEGRGNAYRWEFANAMQEMILDCPEALFKEAFADKLRKKGELSAEELEIEKAFVLLDAFTVNHGNPVLGVRRLDELFAVPEMRNILKDEYDFGTAQIYELHKKNTFYNYEAIKNREDRIAILTDQVHGLELQLQQRGGKVRGLLRKMKGVKSRNLNDGTPAKRKLMLYGFYGHNLGDDMFFDMLFRRYPDVLFAVCDSLSYANFFSKYNNVRLYPADGAFALRLNQLGEKRNIKNMYEKTVRKYTDGGVHIGGSIYQQIGDWENDLENRKERKQKGKSFFGISNNFGPFHTEGYKEFWKEQFKTWNDVCFRDRYSKDLFPDIPTVRYAPDVLFSYSPNNRTETKNRKLLAISVINLRWEFRNIPEEIADAYEAFILRAAEEALENGSEVCFLSFCELQKDSEAIERIEEQIKKTRPAFAGRISKRIYTEHIEEIVDVLAECEAVLATRFHAMVLGYVLGKKVLPVCYSDKATNVIRDLSLTDTWAEIRNPETYPATSIFDAFRALPSERIAELASAAESQFAALDKYLQ